MFDLMLTVLGLIAVFSILAIWIAWSTAMFYGVMIATIAAVSSAMGLAYLVRNRPSK